MKKLLLLLGLLGGCGTSPDRVPPPIALPAPAPSAPAPSAPSSPAPSTGQPAPKAQSETVAVAGLMQSARADAAAGRLANAAASLERALRIEPRNPRLWNELSRVRLQQRDYVQVESTAARSNSFAGGDSALRAANWQLIAQAREARGDASGARAARESARQLSR